MIKIGTTWNSVPQKPTFVQQADAPQFKEKKMAAIDSHVVPSRTKSNSSSLWQERLSAIALYGLLFSMVVAPLMAIKEKAGNTGEGNLGRQLMFLGVLLIALIARRLTNQPSRFLDMPGSLLLTLGYCWLSLSWSQDASIGARRLLLTTIIGVSIFLIVSMLEYRKTIDIVRNVFIFALIANLAAVALIPSFAIHHATDAAGFGTDPSIIGSWKGIMAHKNFAGALTALTLLFFILDANGVKTSIRILVLVASVVFLAGTRSKTSAGITVGALLLGSAYLFYNHRYKFIFISSLALFLTGLGLSVYANWDVISKPFRRPDALTGRVQIWRVLIRYWEDHPWGSGYGSFWNVGANKPIGHYVDLKNWIALAEEAHNGYIDLLVQIGTLGMIISVMSLIVIPIIKLLIWQPETRQRGALLLALVLFCAGHNFTESGILDRDQIVDVFLLLAIALIEQTTRAARQTVLAGPQRHG